MLAMTLTAPPQCSQVKMSILTKSPGAIRASLRLLKIAPGDFTQRLKHYVRRAIPVGCFEAVPNIPLSSERQPLSRDRRARDIAAQAFEILALMRLVRHPGMQRDKIAWSNSEQPQAGPQGEGQDARSNPAAFATELLLSAAATAGTVCKVNALRPWCGPSAIR